MEIREKLGDKRGIASCYNNIGLVLCDLGDYSQALEYYQKALSLREELGLKKDSAQIYDNIAALYRVQNHYDQAIIFLQEELTIRKQLGNQRDINSVLNSLADIYLQKTEDLHQKGFDPEALDAARKGLEFKQQAGVSDNNAKLLEEWVAKLEKPNGSPPNEEATDKP